MRLLLSCALGPERIDCNLQESLAGEVSDWKAFAEKAAEHLAVPFVYRDLTRIGTRILPDVREAIKTKYQVSIARNLRIAALLVRLHEQWFEPRSIRYAAVKGVVLAQRYYGGLVERSCRDLDLLVEPTNCAATLSHLCDIGFRLVGKFALPEDRRQRGKYIEALCDLRKGIKLRSPDGDLIDLHSSLDHMGSDFQTSDLLARTEAVLTLGREIPALSTADIFVYICYHHSRHNWTRLHWLADLGRISASLSFDPNAVRRTARQYGMESLVNSCLEMRELLIGATKGQYPESSDLAGTMARECLAALRLGSEAPILTFFRRLDDIGHRWWFWFKVTGEEWRKRKGLVRKFRTVMRSSTPSWEMYLKLPLPRSLRWLYVPLRIGWHLVKHSPLRKAFWRE